MSEHNPQERISYSGDLEPVLERVSSDYHLGKLTGYEIITTGYEDLNVVLDTDKTKHFVKIFSASRTPEDIVRFENIMSAVLANGVAHPDIYQRDHSLIYHDSPSGLSLSAMEHVDGQTFYDLDRVPDDSELRSIIRQVVVINKTPIKPPALYDSWAVQHTRDNYEPIKSSFTYSDKKLIEGALSQFEQIHLERLPYCFVHGDIIKSNVIKRDNKIFIVDFSVSGWQPRIQELAVMTANLLNDEQGNRSFDETINRVTTLYIEEGGVLTDEEVVALPAYTRVAYAAELVSAKKVDLEGSPPAENDYWMRLGRLGLERSSS